MGALLPEQAIASYVNFLVARGQHVLYDAGDAVTVLVPPVAFGVTAPGPEAGDIVGDSVTLEGLGWVDVATVHRLEGDEESPLELSWSTTTAWSAEVELVSGINVIGLVARNSRGAPVGEAVLSVTSIPIEP